MNNKKGLSELVSYTLLIVIAIGLSVLVYNYLSAYTPKDKPTCSEDVALIVQDSWCKSGSPATVNVTILNKGLFKVDAAYIRFGGKDREVKLLLNTNDLYLTKFVGSSDTGLKPGDSVTRQYQTSQANSPGDYGLEIEPAVFNNNDLALCPGAIIKQSIKCT